MSCCFLPWCWWMDKQMNYEICFEKMINKNHQMTFPKLVQHEKIITVVILDKWYFTIQVNGYIFRRRQLWHFQFSSIFNRGQLFEERICSDRNKFFPSREAPYLNDFVFQERKQKVSKLVFLWENVQKWVGGGRSMMVYQYTLTHWKMTPEEAIGLTANCK